MSLPGPPPSSRGAAVPASGSPRWAQGGKPPDGPDLDPALSPSEDPAGAAEDEAGTEDSEGDGGRAAGREAAPDSQGCSSLGGVKGWQAFRRYRCFVGSERGEAGHFLGHFSNIYAVSRNCMFSPNVFIPLCCIPPREE